MAIVVIGLTVVLAALVGLLLATRSHSSHGSGTTTSTPSSSTSSTSSSSTSTSSSSTSTSSPTSTSSSTTSTTITNQPGNRAATSAERQAIASSVGASHAGYTMGEIRIADSDANWAAIRYVPTSDQAQQRFGEVRHNQGGDWTAVSNGTSQVACDPQVPANVQADFADLSGFGGC
ncbi:MAG: hypothetical protein ACYDH6_21215 [Acidimicrobiales bacterium]